MKSTSVLLLSLLLAGTLGASPRHLTYAYAVYLTRDQKAPVTSFSGPGTGTLDVTLLGKAPDGGMLVEAREWRWNAIRPQQSLQCELYDSGQLTCPEFPVLSDAQETLLPLLAGDFSPGTRSARWQGVQWEYHPASTCAANEDVTYTTEQPNANGILDVIERATYDVPCFHSRTVHEQASIAYDRAAAVPVLVHDVKTGTSEAVFASRSVDLKLLKDSYHPSSSNHGG